jgi:serine palmitoyltransferase
MESPSTTLAPLFGFLEYTLGTAQIIFDKLPGSAVIQRYVKSSHQNDPGRTLLELILVVFAIRTLLQSRTRAEKSGKHFIKFSGNVCLCVLNTQLTHISTSMFLLSLRK